MNRLLLAFLATILLCGVAEAEPQKKKVSAKQAERYCNLSAQERYAHLAKFCKQLQAKKVIPAAAIVAAAYSDDSSASFFRQEKERAEASQFFSGWQKLYAPPVGQKKHKPKPVMAIIDLTTELPKGSTTVSQAYPSEQPVRRENPRPMFAPEPVRIAREWEGYNARKDRTDLTKLLSDGNDMKVDPTHIPWCAGFVNAVLSKAGYQGTGSLLARSFLGYGIPTTYPREGDIVVFARGKSKTAGHVGFYVGEETLDGVKYIKVLGGNQNREVSVAYYPANKLLGYRKLG